jgi:flagellar protein FliS
VSFPQTGHFNRSGVGEYRKQAVSTASPLELIIMLYDATLRHCESGLAAIETRDLNEQNKHLTKAQTLLTELVASLDMERGGEIAQNLFALYSFCLNSLLEANVHDSREPVLQVIHVLTELRTAWEQISNANQKEKTHAA